MLPRALVSSLVALACAVVAAHASAHAVGVSRSVWQAGGAHVAATVTLASADLAALGSAASAPGALLDATVVSADGVRCAGTLVSETSDDGDGVALALAFACPPLADATTVDLAWLARLGGSHRHFLRVASAAGARDDLAFAASPTFVLERAGPAPRARALVEMGLSHILEGADHLVFLAGLLLGARRLRDVALLVTAFTLGHSASLALATLGVFAPSARWVEPLIALSIAWIGVENALRAEVRGRPALTGLFGLVHGFGFAGGLAAIHLPRAAVPGALFAFNVGIEVGQLAVVLPALPLLWLARSSTWFSTRGARLASLGVAAAGVVWFALRVAAR